MSDAASFAPGPAAGEHDVRPVVATGGTSNWGLYAFLALLAVGGAMLFNALNAAREGSQAPSVLVPNGAGQGQIASPEPLQVPDRFANSTPVRLEALPRESVPAQNPSAPRILQPSYQPPPYVPPSYEPPRPALQPVPQVVYDNRGTGSVGLPSVAPSGNRERVTAARFQNPSRTIPQGTVIPAVLETALDSTRPGGVRALVQRDVSSFDGTRVLIPRGSRLYGEYEANLQRGQNRALVQWTRLIRPDGVTIALDSPSSDPLGRAGIKGKVDGKFWQRFGGALLNSVLDIGVGVAVNRATDGVILALPGSTQNVQVADTEAIQPTLKVKHGTSVSVFVARDLDFSSVEN